MEGIWPLLSQDRPQHCFIVYIQRTAAENLQEKTVRRIAGQLIQQFVTTSSAAQKKSPLNTEKGPL